MLKKLFFSAAILVLIGGALVFAWRKSSLVQVWCNDMVTSAKRAVPVETRLSQLDLEVKKIKNDVRRAVEKKVELQIVLNRLQEESKTLEKLQAGRASDLLEMADLLESMKDDAAHVSYRDRKYTAGGLQDKMDAMRRVYEREASLVKSKNDLIAKKQDQLALAEKEIARIQEEEQRLSSEVASLRLQIEQLRLKKLEKGFEVDDSQVSRANALAREIKDELDRQDLLADELAKHGLAPASPNSVDSAPDRPSREDSIKAARKALRGDEPASAKIVNK